MNEPRIHFKDLLKRRDALEMQTVTDPEEYAWDWMKLAADFDELKMYDNAEKCRGRGEYYFSVAPV